MAKRSTGWTENKIAKYQKDGRGQGEFGSYLPWLNIQDVPSEGRSHRPKGWKTHRIHQFLSDLELNYFYNLEWLDVVLDIREQFPILNREETLLIAEQKDIKHPVDNETGVPIVMTTDFLITIRQSGQIKYLARSIKYNTDLHDVRTLEKLEIEREYWIRQDVNWALVTDKELGEKFFHNMNVFHPAYFPKNNEILSYKKQLFEFLYDAEGPLSKELLLFDGEHGLEKGTALALFKHLVAKKEIGFKMNEIEFNPRIGLNRFEYPALKTVLNFHVGREAN